MILDSSSSLNRPGPDAEDDSRSLFSGKSAIYNNHKVVAVPNPLPHQEISAMRGETASTRTGRSRLSGRSGRSGRSGSPRRIKRSHSAGRTVSRSRDLIQDVYDRMGVNYTAGRSSLGNFMNNDAPNSAMFSNLEPVQQGRSIHDIARGRKEAVESAEKEKRQRSLSRGRVSQVWPPQKVQDEAEFTTSTPRKFDDTSNVSVSSSMSYNNYSRASYGGAVAISRDTKQTTRTPVRSMSFSRAYTSQDRPTHSPYGWQQKSQKPAIADESRDEQQAPSNASSSKEKLPRSDLVKDRVSAISDNNTSSSRSVGGSVVGIRKLRSSYVGQASPKPSQFKRRELPPKIDIYGRSKSVEDTKEKEDNKSVISKASIGLDKKRFSSAHSVSGASVGSSNTRRSIGNSYLAAISSPSKQKPFVSSDLTAQDAASQHRVPILEISPSDNPSDEGMGADNLTLSSSASADDFEVKSAREGKRDSSSEAGSHKVGKQSAIITPEMEKIIQEQLRLRTIELENRIAKLEMHLAESNSAAQRVSKMEEKMEKMNDMITHMMNYR